MYIISPTFREDLHIAPTLPLHLPSPPPMRVQVLVYTYISVSLCLSRILLLLEALCLATDEPSFYSALWQCILTSTRGRLPAVSYILSKLNKKATAEDQTQYLGGNLPLMVRYTQHCTLYIHEHTFTCTCTFLRSNSPHANCFYVCINAIYM